MRRAARERGAQLWLEREGAEHEVWRFGDVRVTVPRHREINERLARALLKRLGAR